MSEAPSDFLPVTAGDVTGTKLTAEHKATIKNKMEFILGALRTFEGAWATEDELLRMLTMLFPGTYINPKTLSVQIRNLRKPKMGGHRIDQRYRDGYSMLSEYCLIETL